MAKPLRRHSKDPTTDRVEPCWSACNSEYLSRLRTAKGLKLFSLGPPHAAKFQGTTIAAGRAPSEVRKAASGPGSWKRENKRLEPKLLLQIRVGNTGSEKVTRPRGAETE